jgi:uncharacterized protein (DUF58 family)
LGTAELTTLGLSSLALIVGSVLWTGSRPLPLELHRTVRPARVHVGTDARVDLEITARGPAPQVTVTDAFDDGRRAARFLTPALDRGQRGRAAYRIPTDRRGRFTVGPAMIGIADPFGLTARGVQLGDTTEVIVRPRVHDLRPSPGSAGHHRARAHHRNVVPIASVAHDEFLALREYAAGDDLRRVHWRSSARLGELMVREDESAWRPQTIVVLDNRAGSYRGPSYEAAIEAMASIGSRLLQSTRACEIITTGGVRLGVSHLGGLSSESRLLDELAMLTPDADSPPAASVAALRSDVRRGRMLIITGEPPDLAWFATLAGPGAPVTIVSCGAVLPATSNGVTVIDGRPGALVGAWNVAAITAPSNRRRAGRR